MKKKFSIDEVVAKLNRHPGITIRGLEITLNREVPMGNGTWGKLDFLINHNGYYIVEKKEV